MNTEYAMECFIKKGNQFLILHRANHKTIMPGVSMAPGGRVEENESLFEATTREVLEETGLVIANLKVKALGNVITRDLDRRLIINLLSADYVSGEIEEHTDHNGDFEWLSPEEIAKLPNLLSELREILPHILGESEGVVSYFAEYSQGNNMIEYRIN